MRLWAAAAEGVAALLAQGQERGLERAVEVQPWLRSRHQCVAFPTLMFAKIQRRQGLKEPCCCESSRAPGANLKVKVMAATMV